MGLTGGQMKVKRMTPAVTKNVDFAGYTATGATKGVVLRFLRVPFFLRRQSSLENAVLTAWKRAPEPVREP